MNHHLTSKYDFHSYMIRSMEEEFQRIVGLSGPLWGFVVAFMLFNVKGSNLYFWIVIIPITNAFELASFFWFWRQFGYHSCFIKNHMLVYIRLILGFMGQFLCSYSTLPLHALVTQMGTNYKAALIPQIIRDTIHGWGKEARRRRWLGIYGANSTVHTDTSTAIYVEEYDHHELDSPRARLAPNEVLEIEMQPHSVLMTGGSDFPLVANENSCHAGITPPLRPCEFVCFLALVSFVPGHVTRSSSLPVQRE